MPRDKDSYVAPAVQSGSFADRAIDRRVAPAAAEKVTAQEAKALGFDSTKGITKVDGMYVFDESLAPGRQGFQSVGIAGAGQVQMTPYFGDVTGSYRLTQEQYATAYKGGGMMDSKKILAIMDANEKKAIVDKLKADNPNWTQEQIDNAFQSQLSAKADRINAAVTSGAASSGMTDEAYAQQLLAQEASDKVMAERQSAFSVIKTQFDKFGLGSLADQVKELILGGTSSSEVTMALRQTNEYKKRFAGNEARLKAGLNVYDEATYTDLENAYAEIYSAYGMKELLGDTAETAQEQFSRFIGNTVAPTEVKRRMQIAQTLAMSDTDTKKAIKNLYPMLTDKDIMAYFLSPKDTLPKLEVKAQAAQIGGAFLRQGLSADSTSLENYVAMGVSTEQANTAAANIASVLPRGTFLSELDKTGQQFTQQTAEDIFLKQSAAAINQQEQLKQKERARFQGSSGSNKFSLGTGGTQGAF
jgi:hypothetical protein